ncbi:putative (S)-2-hydroxy-acid oxidase [Helianthus annuus]|uniref:(S)-2-hydroxy-acid oxidase n=1 Tax=Helianthus annuus TaxID=4232 RepID=A0A9K3JF36_HELAN|nr:putative (S)-2-hydroxy-acid oxidase [Helianthus annuus]
MGLSFMSTCTIEEVSSSSDVVRFFELYLKSFEGLVLTEVDDNVGSNLEASVSRNFDPSLSWKNIAWLKSITKMPIMVNCVLTREEAMEVGVEGIILSNHGAHQLDYVPTTIAVIEEVQFKEEYQ